MLGVSGDLVRATGSLPAARDVSGRVEVLPGGEVLFRVRPANIRDVTAHPIHPPAPVHRHYRGCSCRYGTVVAYTAALTPRQQAEDAAVWAWWMDPPWWSAVRWLPDQRRLRAVLRREQHAAELPGAATRPAVLRSVG